MALIEYDEYKQRLRDLGPELEKLSAALSSGHTTNIGSSRFSYSAAARFTLCMPESPETSAGSPPLSSSEGRAAASLCSSIWFIRISISSVL